MKQINLTKGKAALVDDKHFERVNAFKWHYSNSGYALRKIYKGTRNGKKLYENQAMHRLLVDIPDGMQIDHINGDKLDNRQANLRQCTNQQNGCNRGKTAKNTSGFKGVSPCEYGRWQAGIRVNGKRLHLGHFLKKEDAAEAYKAAAIKLHGEFACAE